MELVFAFAAIEIAILVLMAYAGEVHAKRPCRNKNRVESLRRARLSVEIQKAVSAFDHKSTWYSYVLFRRVTAMTVGKPRLKRIEAA